MGEYASIGVREFDFCISKNHINPTWLTLYRESDKELKTILDEDNEERRICEYVSTVKNIKLRLDVMGFTLKKANMEFDLHNESSQLFWFGKNLKAVEVEMKEYSFEKWLDSLKAIVNAPYKHYLDYMDEISVEDFPIQCFMMREDYEGESIFGFVSTDIRYVFRALLEVFDENEYCKIDFSSLVNGGWCYEDDNLCEETLNAIAESQISNDKIIILTEGSSDISILKRSMQALYPAVVDYYSFMDFNTSNASGSASALVTYIKAFIGSKLKNRIIAVFDNDTAANEAMRGLNKVEVPNNIRVLTYPNLDSVKNYPTLGPHGIVTANINGLACSIELYLGFDMLKDEKGELFPVQWKGYSQSLNKYQGEILNKEVILQKYYTFLNDMEKSETLDTDHDWYGVDKILQMIFKAYE